VAEREQWGVTSGIGLTALAVAHARALETRRPDGLVRDPLAERFVAACDAPGPYHSWPTVDSVGKVEPPAWWVSMPTYVSIRARFFDDFLTEVTAAGVRQVVLVAAGLDTRAFRLDWPAGTTVYEVDQPSVLAFKDKVLGEHGLAARCRRLAVRTDLRDDWPAALRAAGFDPASPVVWLAEGLLSYVSARVESDLFEGVRQLSAPGSRLALDAIAGNLRDRVVGSPASADWERYVGVRADTVWNTELRAEPVDVMRAGGWKVDVARLAEAAQRYGRPVPGVMNAAADVTMLLTAAK
jgi:methyltransferase (TIGR00027 family)